MEPRVARLNVTRTSFGKKLKPENIFENVRKIPAYFRPPNFQPPCTSLKEFLAKLDSEKHKTTQNTSFSPESISKRRSKTQTSMQFSADASKKRPHTMKIHFRSVYTTPIQEHEKSHTQNELGKSWKLCDLVQPRAVTAETHMRLIDRPRRVSTAKLIDFRIGDTNTTTNDMISRRMRNKRATLDINTQDMSDWGSIGRLKTEIVEPNESEWEPKQYVPKLWKGLKGLRGKSQSNKRMSQASELEGLIVLRQTSKKLAATVTTT